MYYALSGSTVAHGFYTLNPALPSEAQIAIRTFPSKEADAVGLLNHGDILEVSSRSNEWLQIAAGDSDDAFWIMWTTGQVDLLVEVPDHGSGNCEMIEPLDEAPMVADPNAEADNAKAEESLTEERFGVVLDTEPDDPAYDSANSSPEAPGEANAGEMVQPSADDVEMETEANDIDTTPEDAPADSEDTDVAAATASVDATSTWEDRPIKPSRQQQFSWNDLPSNSSQQELAGVEITSPSNGSLDILQTQIQSAEAINPSGQNDDPQGNTQDQEVPTDASHWDDRPIKPASTSGQYEWDERPIQPAHVANISPAKESLDEVSNEPTLDVIHDIENDGDADTANKEDAAWTNGADEYASTDAEANLVNHNDDVKPEDQEQPGGKYHLDERPIRPAPSSGQYAWDERPVQPASTVDVGAEEDTQVVSTEPASGVVDESVDDGDVEMESDVDVGDDSKQVNSVEAKIDQFDNAQADSQVLVQPVLSHWDDRPIKPASSSPNQNSWDERPIQPARTTGAPSMEERAELADETTDPVVHDGVDDTAGSMVTADEVAIETDSALQVASIEAAVNQVGDSQDQTQLWSAVESHWDERPIKAAPAPGQYAWDERPIQSARTADIPYEEEYASESTERAICALSDDANDGNAEMEEVEKYAEGTDVEATIVEAETDYAVDAQNKEQETLINHWDDRPIRPASASGNHSWDERPLRSASTVNTPSTKKINALHNAGVDDEVDMETAEEGAEDTTDTEQTVLIAKQYEVDDARMENQDQPAAGSHRDERPIKPASSSGNYGWDERPIQPARTEAISHAEESIGVASVADGDDAEMKTAEEENVETGIAEHAASINAASDEVGNDHFDPQDQEQPAEASHWDDRPIKYASAFGQNAWDERPIRPPRIMYIATEGAGGSVTDEEDIVLLEGIIGSDSEMVFSDVDALDPDDNELDTFDDIVAKISAEAEKIGDRKDDQVHHSPPDGFRILMQHGVHEYVSWKSRECASDDSPAKAVYKAMMSGNYDALLEALIADEQVDDWLLYEPLTPEECRLLEKGQSQVIDVLYDRAPAPKRIPAPLHGQNTRHQMSSGAEPLNKKTRLQSLIQRSPRSSEGVSVFDIIMSGGSADSILEAEVAKEESDFTLTNEFKYPEKLAHGAGTPGRSRTYQNTALAPAPGLRRAASAGSVGPDAASQAANRKAPVKPTISTAITAPSTAASRVSRLSPRVPINPLKRSATAIAKTPPAGIRVPETLPSGTSVNADNEDVSAPAEPDIGPSDISASSSATTTSLPAPSGLAKRALAKPTSSLPASSLARPRSTAQPSRLSAPQGVSGLPQRTSSLQPPSAMSSLPSRSKSTTAATGLPTPGGGQSLLQRRSLLQTTPATRPSGLQGPAARAIAQSTGTSTLEARRSTFGFSRPRQPTANTPQK